MHGQSSECCVYCGGCTVSISTRLLIVNAVVFVLQATNTGFIYEWFALWPLGTPELEEVRGQLLRVPDFQIWQVLTYGFMHGSVSHLFFNMLALYVFGRPVEQYLGPRRFIQYYFTCLVGAGLIQLLVASSSGEIYPTVGASGAVFGLLLAFGLLFPNHMVLLLFPPIPMRAKWFVLIYGAIELLMGVTGTMPQVAHFAHLGGMLFGFILLWRWSSLRRR